MDLDEAIIKADLSNIKKIPFLKSGFKQTMEGLLKKHQVLILIQK